MPGVPSGPVSCRAVVADTTLQCRVDIWGSAASSADRGGGTSF